jgi:hypothetical protein
MKLIVLLSAMLGITLCTFVSDSNADSSAEFSAQNNIFDVGSLVSVSGFDRLSDGEHGKLTVDIKGLNKTETKTYHNVNINFDKCLILVAVPDDRVNVDYQNITMKYCNKGSWGTFVSYKEKETGAIGKSIAFAAGFIPMIGDFQKFLGGFTLIDDIMKEKPDLKTPQDPRFTDKNGYDLIEIGWAKPTVPGYSYQKNVNDELGSNSAAHLRISIPIAVAGEPLSGRDVAVYALYTENVSYSKTQGDRLSVIKNYREKELSVGTNPIPSACTEGRPEAAKIFNESKNSTPEELVQTIFAALKNNDFQLYKPILINKAVLESLTDLWTQYDKEEIERVGMDQHLNNMYLLAENHFSKLREDAGRNINWDESVLHNSDTSNIMKEKKFDVGDFKFGANNNGQSVQFQFYAFKHKDVWYLPFKGLNYTGLSEK